jgi:hypothetical protein
VLLIDCVRYRKIRNLKNNNMIKKLVLVGIFLTLINFTNRASAEVGNFEDPKQALETIEAPWVIKTDKTERSSVGSSAATLLKAGNELQFQGTLAAISGNEGLVGFAFIETPVFLDLTDYKYIEFYARSQDLKVVYTLKIKDDQEEQSTGTLAFEQEFVVGTEWTLVKLPVSHFQPKIRGKLANNFELHLSQVRSLSFQINRSNQEAGSPIPLEFALDISSQVYLTNQD